MKSQNDSKEDDGTDMNFDQPNNDIMLQNLHIPEPNSSQRKMMS